MKGKLLQNTDRLKKKLVEDIQSSPDENSILRKDYDDKPFVVTYVVDDISLFFYIRHVDRRNGCSSLKSICSFDKITINDIQCSLNNKGYDSILMNELIDFSKNNNIEYIEGWLSESDIEDHGDRLFHFYRKFDFEIIEPENSEHNRYDKDVFQIEDNFIRCTIPFDVQVLSQIEKRNVGLSVGLNDGLNKTEKKVINILIENPDHNAEELSEKIGVSKRTIERTFSSLQQKGVLERMGSKRDGRWRVIK